MFSNLSQNSILYIWDLKNNPKIISGPVERVSIPRPKYSGFNPNLESVVDIIANINGEKREFKDVPNTSIADFGNNTIVLAESKDMLNSYITSMYQNAKGIIENAKKQEELLPMYEASLEELNPTLRNDREKDKAIQSLQDEVSSLKDGISQILAKLEGKQN